MRKSILFFEKKKALEWVKIGGDHGTKVMIVNTKFQATVWDPFPSHFQALLEKKNRQNRQKNEDRYIWWANVRQVKILFMIRYQRFFNVFVLIAILSEWSTFVLVDIPTNRQWTHPHARRWYRTLYEGLGEYTGFFFIIIRWPVYHHHLPQSSPTPLQTPQPNS